MAKGDWKIWVMIVFGVVVIGAVGYGIYRAVHALDDAGLMDRNLLDAATSSK